MTAVPNRRAMPSMMSEDEAVKCLVSLVAWCEQSGDKEETHRTADAVLLAYLRGSGAIRVAGAWEVTREECGGFWYA